MLAAIEFAGDTQLAAFEYQALDSNGKTRQGVIEADTARGARSLLRDQGLNPLEVAQVREGNAAASTSLFSRERLRTGERAVLARELSTLIGSGLPIDEALSALAEQAETPRQQSLVSGLRAKVMEGQSLASAMRVFPGSFDDLFCATVAAGEQSGRLPAALEALAAYTERRDELQRKLWMAAAYPVLVTLIALGIVTGLLTFVVPQITGVFANVNRELPLLTKVLIALSTGLKTLGPWLLLGLIALAATGWQALKNPATRLRFDAWRLRAPLIGRLTRAAGTASSMRTLGMLIGTGVPVLDALKIGTLATPNQAMQAALKQVAVKVREGGAFARALADTGQFPQVALRLVASGEKTGRLGELLQEAARHQERDLDARLNTVMAVLGPLMILVVGALVLFIVLAIMLPIFQLNTLIR